MSRPILPLLISGGDSPPQEESPHSSNAPDSDPQKRQYAKRGAISKIACRSCRRRKTKCNSERPTCQNCAGRAEKCIYDFDESDRSLTFLRENIENLIEERTALESLLKSMASGPEPAATELVQRLRSGLDLYTLANQVHASRVLTEVRTPGSANSPSSTLSRIDQYEQLIKALSFSLPAEVEEIVRRLRVNPEPGPVLQAIRAKSLLTPLHTTETISSIEGEFSGYDQKFRLVKNTGLNHQLPQSSMRSEQADVAKPYGNNTWTEVTDDEDLIDQLFRIYFAWQHTFFQNFPEELFRADYTNGQTRYCSKLLVNSICAAGCLLSRGSKVLQRPDFTLAGEHFYAAAVVNLGEMTGPSVCTVAALSLLAHFEGARGNVKRMWEYTGRSGRMALDLSLHLMDRNSGTSRSESGDIYEEALRHTFWGCFITDQVTSFTLGRLHQIPLNAITTRRPSVDHGLDAKEWVAYYDSSDAVTPGATSTTFKELVSLCAIMNSTLTLFFSPTQTISGMSLLTEHNKYLKWRRMLPEILRGDGKIPPHVLCVHLLWHAAVLLLFRPFLKAKLTESNVVPQDICRQSANSISELFARHRSFYGLTGIYAIQLQCLLTACTIHILHIPAILSTKHFVDACNSLHDMKDQNKWAWSSLDEIKRLVRKWNRVLPGDAEAALYRHEGKPSEPEQLPPIIADLEGPHVPGSASSSLWNLPNGLEKRPGISPWDREAELVKRARTARNRTPQLFAPSESQPAPLPGPARDEPDAEPDEDDLMSYFPGLDFSTDDILDPFVDFGGAYEAS